MERFDALKAVARNLGDLVVDAVPGSYTGTSVDISKLVQPLDDQLKGDNLYLYSGAGAGQDRVVSEFEPANNRLLFTQPFATTPSTNTNVILTKYWSKDDYDNAIDRAVGRVRLMNYIPKVGTLAIVGTQYEYAVPSGFAFISTLRLVPTTGSDYDSDEDISRMFELSPRFWRIETNVTGSYVISFDRRKIDLTDFDNLKVKVVGQIHPSVAGTDNADIPEHIEEFVIADASARLSSQRLDENREWYSKYNDYSKLASKLEVYATASNARGKRVGTG